MSDDLVNFLDWQSSRQADGKEQKRFREDTLLYPKLLVFAAMCKKSPFVHPIHSAGTYPKIPGADPEWQGKSIGFLGDRTQFASPQMVDLGKITAWAWEEQLIPMDTLPMETFYQDEVNRLKFWTPEANVPTIQCVCLHTLALPPDCVAFCATQRHTPAELLNHIGEMVSSMDIDPIHFNLMIDWCCMAAMLGTGVNGTSSDLSFALPAVMGTTEHLQEWAHHCITMTLGPMEPATHKNLAGAGTTRPNNTPENSPDGQRVGSIDMGVLSQVTAVVVPAFHAGHGIHAGATPTSARGQWAEEPRPYSKFQLAKLKGFCCI